MTHLNQPTLAHVASALASLGHEARLSVFTELVRAGHEGMRVGELTAQLNIAPSTLAHHLRMLVETGLVTQEKRGREVINRPNFKVLNQTLDFITSECCTGKEH